MASSLFGAMDESIKNSGVTFDEDGDATTINDENGHNDDRAGQVGGEEPDTLGEVEARDDVQRREEDSAYDNDDLFDVEKDARRGLRMSTNAIVSAFRQRDPRRHLSKQSSKAYEKSLLLVASHVAKEPSFSDEYLSVVGVGSSEPDTSPTRRMTVSLVYTCEGETVGREDVSVTVPLRATDGGFQIETDSSLVRDRLTPPEGYGLTNELSDLEADSDDVGHVIVGVVAFNDGRDDKGGGEGTMTDSRVSSVVTQYVEYVSGGETIHSMARGHTFAGTRHGDGTVTWDDESYTFPAIARPYGHNAVLDQSADDVTVTPDSDDVYSRVVQHVHRERSHEQVTFSLTMMIPFGNSTMTTKPMPLSVMVPTDRDRDDFIREYVRDVVPKRQRSAVVRRVDVQDNNVIAYCSLRGRDSSMSRHASGPYDTTTDVDLVALYGDHYSSVHDESDRIDEFTTVSNCFAHSFQRQINRVRSQNDIKHISVAELDDTVANALYEWSLSIVSSRRTTLMRRRERSVIRSLGSSSHYSLCVIPKFVPVSLDGAIDNMSTRLIRSVMKSRRQAFTTGVLDGRCHYMVGFALVDHVEQRKGVVHAMIGAIMYS